MENFIIIIKAKNVLIVVSKYFSSVLFVLFIIIFLAFEIFIVTHNNL